MKKFNLFILFSLLIPSLCFGGWYYSKIETGGGGAGTVSYASTGSFTAVSDATNEATAPSNSSGDLLIACVSDDADQAVTGWDGFTQITSQTQSSHRLSVAYIVADGTTSYTFTKAGASSSVAFIFRLTKDQGTWTIADFDSAGASAAAVTCPDMTVGTDNSMALIIYGNDDDFDLDETPTGMTLIAEYDTLDPRLAAWYQSYDISGSPVTDKTCDTISGGDQTIIGVVVEAQ